MSYEQLGANPKWNLVTLYVVEEFWEISVAVSIRALSNLWADSLVWIGWCGAATVPTQTSEPAHTLGIRALAK